MSYFPLTEPGVLRKTGDSDLGQGRSLEYLVILDSTDIMEDYKGTIKRAREVLLLAKDETRHC